MALLRHRRYGPRFSSAPTGARGVPELPEKPPPSDEIPQMLVGAQLKPQGETASPGDRANPSAPMGLPSLKGGTPSMVRTPPIFCDSNHLYSGSARQSGI